MSRYFKILVALGLIFSFTEFPITGFAEEEASNEATAEAEDKDKAMTCKEAKVTSKNREASNDDREEAKQIYKACKKEARAKKRAQCIPSGSRLNRC